MPSAPTGVTATPGSGSGSGSLTASWTASSSVGTGATSIIRYRALAFTGDGVLAGSRQTQATPPATPATTCTVTGLTPGVNYTIQVRAWNNLGRFGDLSAASSAAQPTS